MTAAPLIALALGATLASPSDMSGAAARMVRWIFGNDVVQPKLDLTGSGGESGRGKIVLTPSQQQQADDDETEEDKAADEQRRAEREARNAAREAARQAREAAREAQRNAREAERQMRDRARQAETSARDADADARRRTFEVSPPVPPAAPVPPVPPRPPGAGSVKLRKFSLHTKDAPAVDVLHRIAQSAGWTLTVAGVGDDRIDLDVEDVDPREAVRQVLKASQAWGVLRGDRLVVVPAGEGGLRAGELVERRRASGRSRKGSGGDVVRVFHGDLTVPRGTVVGDAVVVGGNLVVEPGALVQGDAVTVLGGLNVEPGGMVMGDGVAVLGRLDVEPGGQILGENVQVGAAKLFKGKSGRSWFGRAGLFGFFPTLAFFALVYLVGLLALFTAPERLRGIGATLLTNPGRSVAIGILSWLLVLPVVVLLCVTIVGIPLVPLVPLAIFLSFALGLSAIALRIGELLPAGPGQKFVPTAALGMGMAVVTLASFVPLIGFAAIMLIQFAAVGAVVASKVGKPPLSAVPDARSAA